MRQRCKLRPSGARLGQANCRTVGRLAAVGSPEQERTVRGTSQTPPQARAALEYRSTVSDDRSIRAKYSLHLLCGNGRA